MFRALLWKEWVEQRWRMAFGAVVVGSLTMVGLNARMLPDDRVLVTCCIIGAVLAMLVGMGVVAPERESGTLRTLLFLPIRPATVLLAKGVVAALVCLVPLAVSLAVALLQAGEREMALPRIFALYGVAMLMALTLLVWTVSLSIRAGSESRAGLVAIGIIATAVLFAAICRNFGVPERISAPWQPFLASIYAISEIVDSERRPSWPIFPIQAAMAAALILFALWQFPRFARRSR